MERNSIVRGMSRSEATSHSAAPPPPPSSPPPSPRLPARPRSAGTSGFKAAQ